ncbi:glycoside hydrolase superfamily [Halteromyces radiatus]|uniref:glycoside hydrolase superfamily n=1 Tax=Halteromyces radiatus TaxID=101107 RepID=UPI0022204C6B|nr:glycoside hydrolase superfamily [Halteromyces radiatus]KAI8096245.1 glycoside hydrolase superfamily [Halteromyces radiatus]
MDALRQDIGQLLMCGFHGLEPTDGILDLIRNHNLGSIILFSRNIGTAAQVQKLNHTLQQAAKDAGHKRPLFIAVDQENGVVRRLGKSGTYLPGNMALGAMNSTTKARQVAQVTSKELLTLGMNWNLAPDMDVNNNALNPVIGVRSYGEEPTLVGRLGLAQVEGYQKGGVATSIKHFPGHGDTATDSHLGVPVIDKSLQELQQVELVPFKQAIDAKGLAQPASVMIGHMSLPQLIKKTPGISASLAPEIATDLLRQRLHYRGIIITDCLEMDAVKDTVGCGRGAVLALDAGNDMVMISHTYEFQKDAFSQIYQSLESNGLDQDALRQSVQRVNDLKDKYLSWDDVLTLKPLDTVGCVAHQDLSRRLYDGVPTVISNKSQVIPIHPASDQAKILFLAAHVPMTLAIDSEAEPFQSFYESIMRRHANTEYIIYSQDNMNQLFADDKKIQQADYVIVGTANANLHPFQVELVKRVQKVANHKLVVAAVINPYDLMEFPGVDTYMVTYEYTPPAHEAAVRIIFGEIQSQSQLPVTIPGITTTTTTTTTIETVDNKHVMIQQYDETDDLDQVFGIWTNTFAKKGWPLDKTKMRRVLTNPTTQPVHFVARTTHSNQVVGFAATMIGGDEGKDGQLALLMVDPAYQGHGIGSKLHDTALEHLRSHGATATLRLGSNYPRFFCGLPSTHDEYADFFIHRGWQIATTQVHDLMGDLTGYKTADRLVQRMQREKIWFGRITPKDLWQLFAFQQKYFPYWLSTYKHHADVGDFQDLLVARQGNADGRILASTIIYTTNGSHEQRADLIWTDPDLFGQQSGGMACVGVASEERGRGIGLGMVAYANQVLAQRGVVKSYVDWVELLDFYALLDYTTWRSYRTVTC